ncbi:MAG: 3-isopropylmalate dehydratase small subunit [Sulfitobacter sp.]
MAGWTIHKGEAAHLPHDNIDTDQIIPARFMSQPRSAGYGEFLFHDMRRNADGTLDPAFPLNGRTTSSILIAGRNFGSGSSREAAVYALVDAGIKVVIAPAFGDIFASNAVNNGLLPAHISRADAEKLAHSPSGAEVSIDLTDRTITVGGHSFAFVLQESWRSKLVNGWDDIDLTLQHADAIEAFKGHAREATPCKWPTSKT